jgi:hypothetical protein
MTESRASFATRASALLAAALLGSVGWSCSDAGSPGAANERMTLDTTRLCALVPARDPAAAAFPPSPPVEPFGTDLGWTYQTPDGRVPILFGDTWQRIDICPLQPNDDAVGELQLPASDWPGFTTTSSLPDEQCLDVTYPANEAGTAFAPITLTRWDGVPVPLPALHTPLGGFWDGVREWAVFIVDGGQSCSAEDAASGAVCPSELSPHAADLRCAEIGNLRRCVDPTSPRRLPSNHAYYLHLAERTGPSSWTSRAMFLTNKFLNLGMRTVRAFDPDDARRNDYAVGEGALLLWGRPGFDDLAGDGDLLPFFAWHPLPLQVVDGRLDFAPRFLTGLDGGRPLYGDRQADAVPLYPTEIEPVNQISTSWIAPLGRWLMIYSGASTDFADPDFATGRGQPSRGGMHARLARDPWGPWSEPQPILTLDQAAGDQVCGHRTPPGCLAPPDPAIRPRCLETFDPLGGGYLYGANVIDPLTRAATTADGRAAADVFWTHSAWHPYGVVLVRTRVALE